MDPILWAWRNAPDVYVDKILKGAKPADLDLPPVARPSGLHPLHAWLDPWHGIGLIEQGLARQEHRALAPTRDGRL